MEHKNAGPAAVLLEPLIERDPTKLDQLSRQMAAAEEAGRAGDVEAVYMAQRDLAQVCEQAGDTWLSDHFYRRLVGTWYSACVFEGLELKWMIKGLPQLSFDDKRRLAELV